jgi:Ca2+-binding EF-hand superfamily protein
MLSSDEIDRVRASFDRFDRDGNGVIDLWELRETLKQVGQEPTEEDLILMLSEVDTQEKGFIDFSDFLRLVGTTKTAPERKAVERDNGVAEIFIALGGNPDKT